MSEVGVSEGKFHAGDFPELINHTDPGTCSSSEDMPLHANKLNSERIHFEDELVAENDNNSNLSNKNEKFVNSNKKQSVKAGSGVEGQKRKNEFPRPVCSRTSKRSRRIPKVFTPNSDSVYCLCQSEDCGWYLVCNFRYEGCFIYYHSKCVGLGHLKCQEDGKKYSNCGDGKSYICPLCEIKHAKIGKERHHSPNSISFGERNLPDELFEEIPMQNCSENSKAEYEFNGQQGTDDCGKGETSHCTLNASVDILYSPIFSDNEEEAESDDNLMTNTASQQTPLGLSKEEV